MITIQSAMLIALGFFAAGLIGFLLAPLYGRRSARIATDKLRATMPLSSAEIAADKDRLRAKYALTIHKLEQKLERGAYAAARQRVEINRRDAGISELEGEVEGLRSTLEEHENARRVLEQTIAERMPKVEVRLNEAKKLLFQRDREIANLTQSSERQKNALEEVTQINAQQRDDIHRLNATLAARAARNRETLSDPRFDGEVALRSEIEALRAKTRDQGAVISKLQGVLSKSGTRPDQIPGSMSFGDQMGADNDANANDNDGKSANADPANEIDRLRKSLAAAENALKSARGMAEAGHAGQAALEAEVRQMKTIKEDQAAEIARLKAALSTYEVEDAGDRAVKESKVSMRARLSALEAEAAEHNNTIQRLRAEIAAANEKLARQAAHFMDEMRRLGAGTLPTGPRREATVKPKVPLVDRIKAPRPPRDAANGEGRSGGQAREGDRARVNGFLRALDGAAAGADSPKGVEREARNGSDGAKSTSDEKDGKEKPQRRPSLIERITRAEKPVA